MDQTAEIEVEEISSAWKTKALVIGTVVGALVGLGSAYLMIHNAEKSGRELKVTAGEGVKLGVLVMGLLRQIGQLGE